MCTDMNKKKHLDIDNPAEEMIVILEHWKKRKQRRCILRRCLVAVIFCCGIGLGVFEYFHLYNQLPTVLRVKAGEVQVLDLGLPMTGEIVAASEQDASNIPRERILLDLSKEVELQMWENND